jgi:TIR domain
MKTKIFISWSGEKSKNIALVLKEWVPLILPSVEAFVSDEDIEKGSRSLNIISSELQEARYGIFCLTAENLSSPWIYFEAGAISKTIDNSRIMPILFDIEGSDISKGNPLLQFQYTTFEKGDFLKCLKAVNGCCGDQAIIETNLAIMLDSFWEKIYSAVESAIKNATTIEGNTSRTKSVKDRDILEEILKEVRSQSIILARSDTKTVEPGVNAQLIDRLVDTYKYLTGVMKEYALNNVAVPEDLRFQISQMADPIITLAAISKREDRRSPSLAHNALANTESSNSAVERVRGQSFETLSPKNIRDLAEAAKAMKAIGVRRSSDGNT